MYITMMKSKIHRAVVTDADLNYMGSVTIDQELMEAADIIEFEKVQIVNNNNGARFETYVIKGEKGSGIVCLNGAAARLVQKGDMVIIISYCQVDRKQAADVKPRVVFVDQHNRIINVEHKG